MGTRHRTLYTSANCFFITSTIHEWLELLIDERYFKVLDESIVFVCQKYHSHIISYVWMKNHIHLILFFDKEPEFSNLMRDFKKFTGRQIRKLLQNDVHNDLLNQLICERRTQKFKIWQDRFDAVQIKSKEVLLTKLSYIHNNPVRKGYCATSEEYIHSSAGFYSGVGSRIPIMNAGEIIY
jgi:REP element-mobilizing transposase RayT